MIGGNQVVYRCIRFFSDGKWLTTIQAYSLKEEGQLFLLNITGSSSEKKVVDIILPLIIRSDQR